MTPQVVGRGQYTSMDFFKLLASIVVHNKVPS
jgi:hypothetical protein